jgi:hypothetical protein
VKNGLSRERCDVSSDVVSILPTHRKIHLGVRAGERRHEIILVESVFATNYLKGRRVCDDTPRTPANDVACRASILSYMPATFNIPSGRHSRHKEQRDASTKTNSIALHKALRFLIRAGSVSYCRWKREERTCRTSVPLPGPAGLAAGAALHVSKEAHPHQRG